MESRRDGHQPGGGWCSRTKRHQAMVAAESGTEATEPQGAAEPGSKRMTGLSPEAWERFGKLAVALLEAVSKLIDAISKLH
jgi:hypothetical protein